LTVICTIPLIGAASAWRDAARRYLAAGVPPEDISWGGERTERGLFDGISPLPPARDIKVPRRFIQLADSVVWHAAPDRFARLYALIWRLRSQPGLMGDRADPQVNKLLAMEKNVHRCQHKMKAFVRFREITEPGANRRAFAAWFEPSHYTVEPTATFFRKRFADMDWQILTPDVCAIYDGDEVRFEEGCARPDLPQDASEALWITYFRNIFNPARLKINAMQSEMPKKYWKNLPEAASIPDLIANAPARARAMALAAPTQPPARMGRVQAQQATHISAWKGSADKLDAEIRACTRCSLHCAATQAVLGEGPKDAALMVVGEQPGDHEDLQGRPFIGPAGQLFDQVALQAGLDRGTAYLTNAVKHFKYEPVGRRRIHRRPDAGEIDHCRWWLDAELKIVKPQLALAMGATAARALTGNGSNILRRRGHIEERTDGTRVLITLHPAALLRMPDADQARAFAQDLAKAAVLTAPA